MTLLQVLLTIGIVLAVLAALGIGAVCLLLSIGPHDEPEDYGS